MLFNSFEFLIFFPIVSILFFLSPHLLRIPLLLMASYYFYMAWNPKYLALILLSTVIDYWAARKIHASNIEAKRRFFLAISLTLNLGLLFLFKYLNFALKAISSVLNYFGLSFEFETIDIVLPVGISFYTFQTIGYTIDVFRRKVSPTDSFLQFALYVAYFPQLVAGPIERSAHLLPQLKRQVKFHIERVISGLQLMVWGLFKKVVIADRLAIVVEAVFQSPHQMSGPYILIAAYFFAFQIFCDFSGYSDIAIGASRVLGVELMSNFNRPYSARSITDFWRRWHISLSTWFRDYVYLPLGGSRVTISRHCINLLIVFVISGLWHGANYTFLIWGLFHGLLLVAEVLGARVLKNLNINASKTLAFPIQFFRWFLVFHLVCISWIFFRAESVSTAFLLLQNLTSGWQESLSISLLGIDTFNFAIAVAGILLLEIIQFSERQGLALGFMMKRPLILQYLVFSFLIFSILFFGVFDYAEFIYFQF